MQVISMYLNSGKTIIYVLSDAQPNPSFKQSTVNLEVVYFAKIIARIKNIFA
jgi:hypothetical protein